MNLILLCSERSALSILCRNIILIILTICSFSERNAQADVPSDFQAESVIEELESPSYINISPDGRMFISERINGRLLVAKLDGATGEWTKNSAPFYTFNTPKDSNGLPSALRSSGLRDIAFDPEFSLNGYIYAYYMNDETRHNRVVRISTSRANPDLSDPSSETLLLNLPFNGSTSSGSHNGGSLAFGEDGLLYISTGDGWSGGNPVQSLSTFTGKILRIATDGTIPAGNPFYTQASGDYRAIYCLGLRNPFTMSVHPITGAIYINEARGDEKGDIYIVEPAANFGHQGSGIGNLRSPWANATRAGGQLITGGVWYPDSGSFPGPYHGVYFSPLWGSNSQSTGNISYIESNTNTSARLFATNIGRLDSSFLPLKPVDIAVATDGYLYYLLTTYQTNEGSVERIRPIDIDTALSPSFSPSGGNFEAPVEVTIATETAGADIRYTLDGTVPNDTSTLYTAPLAVDTTVTLVARAFRTGLSPSVPVQGVYHIGSSDVNQPPVLYVPDDQIVELGAQVVLDGSGSYDPDGDDLLLTGESWTQTAGASVDVVNSNDEIAYFFATEPGTYEFELSISDTIDVSTARHIVTVVEALPPRIENLQLLLNFDDDQPNTTWDGSGHRNHFTLNSAAIGSGFLGAALELNGSSAFASRASAELVGELPGSGANSFSISSWVKLGELNKRQPIISKQGNRSRGFLLSVESDNRPTLQLFKDQTLGSTIAADAVLAANVWYHVAATYEYLGDGSSEARLYVDGALVASSNAFVGPPAGNLTALEVGRYYWNSSTNYYLDGHIDQLAVYNTPLSAVEVEQIATGDVGPVLFACNDGLDNDGDGVVDFPNDPDCTSAIDDDESGPIASFLHYYAFSGNANDGGGLADGTIFGNPRFVAGAQGQALEFDGQGDYVSLGAIDVGGSALTLAAWIRPADLENCGPKQDCRIVSKATGTGAHQHYFMLSTINNGGKLRFRLRTNGRTTTLVGSNSQGLVSEDTWSHVAATYDGSAMKLYLNGALVGQAEKAGAMNTNPNVEVRIGDTPGRSRKYFNGAIDEVIIHDAVLSEEELQSLAQGLSQ